jgi:hypothetical protein
VLEVQHSHVNGDSLDISLHWRISVSIPPHTRTWLFQALYLKVTLFTYMHNVYVCHTSTITIIILVSVMAVASKGFYIQRSYLHAVVFIYIIYYHFTIIHSLFF